MQFLASRLPSARRAVAFSTVLVTLQFTACSSDSPGVVSPAQVNTPSLQVIDLSKGSVIADIKSGWQDTECVAIRNGSLYDGARTELRQCTGASAQKFEFTLAGEIKIGSTFCLDAYGASGNPGDRLVIWSCHGGSNQKWTLTSANQIKGINGLCVSFNGHPSDGTRLVVDTCQTNDSGQKWTAGVTSTPTAPPAVAASVSVGLNTASITIGQTAQATATVKDANGNTLTGQTVSWTSTSSSVASVTAAGLATALTVGTANITATVGSVTGMAVLTVTSSTTTPTPPPPAAGGSCSAAVTGTAAMAASALGKPGYLQSVVDPEFKTRITRITGDPGTAIPGVGGTWPTVAYHNYSKDQAWTADQQLLVLKQMKGTGFALFLDGTTYQPAFTRAGPPGGGEWRLHPTLPDVAVNLTSGGEVRHWNVRTNASTVKVAAVSGYTANEMGPSEGNLSNDGAWLVAKAVRSSDGHLVARVLDVNGGRAGAVIDLTAGGVSSLDWVTVSAGGGYVVAYGVIDGAKQRTKVWNRDGSPASYFQDYTFGHYDLGFDAAGNEVAFGAVGQTPYAHHFIARRLDSGAITDLTGSVTSYNWHAGTRNTGRAGWGFAATNDVTGYALDGEIYAVKLDGSKRVERYAHHRSNNIDYDSAPFPTPSPDGKRVVFASNWGASTGRPVQAYVVDMRPICP
jgi:hypothetical protein